MPVNRFVEILKTQEPYCHYVTHIEDVPPRLASLGHPREPLALPLQDYLDQRGLLLRRHQAEAIDHLRAGHHLMITTPTASGKTLAFNLPIVEFLTKNSSATALYLYPTKALSQDQLTGLVQLTKGAGVNLHPAVYDGDTTKGQRARIREESRVLLTNFYFLHQILAWAHQSERFYRNLAFVVIDEAHAYRGVLGSNVALLIRRLRRLLAMYGATPQFVLASATIANPEEFGERLTGLPMVVVDRDGSNRGRQTVVFYNPEALGAGTASPHQETARIMATSIASGLQSLCFTQSRRMAELITRWTQERLEEINSSLVATVSPYRAGYLPSERRALESGLKAGRIRGMVSTNALEVGMDVGGLDTVIVSGFPGTMISLRQQMGRVGRSGGDAVVVWIPFQDQIDQYLAKHPNLFFDRPHEHAIVDLDNPYILAGHLLCATAERPLAATDIDQYFGSAAALLLHELEHKGLIRETSRGWVYQGMIAPAQRVAINGIGLNRTVQVMAGGRLLETVDWAKACEEVHPGAVLLHRAETYVVSSLDLDQNIAQAEVQSVDYWTEPRKYVDIRILEERRRQNYGDFCVVLGDVEITQQVTGYTVKKYDQVVGYHLLTLPPVIYRTMGLWITVPDTLIHTLQQRWNNVGGALHGAEHAMIGIMPLYVLCDRRDLGGVSTLMHRDTQAPTIFIYEGIEGGIGLMEKGYDLIRNIVTTTHQVVTECSCEDGCPACVLSPKCGNDNQPMDKQGAIDLLRNLAAALGSHPHNTDS